MKVCSRCGAQLNDNADSCSRCGSRSFAPVGQTPQQNMNHQPMSQQNMYQQNWQQQTPQQGSMPQQNINQQSIQQQTWGQQPQMPGQQPYIQRPQQPGQNPNVIRPNIPGQQVQSQYGVNNQQNMSDEPDPLAVPEKKGFLGKKDKKQKQPQQPHQAQMGNNQTPYGVPGQQLNNMGMPNQNQQYNPQQTPYGQNTPNNVDPLQNNSTDMTAFDWIKTFILLLIPIYNLIMIIKGMNNSAYPLYRRNYFKAYLIYFLVSLGISTAFALIVTLL